MQVLSKGQASKIGWQRKLFCTGKGGEQPGCDALLLIEFNDLCKTYKSSANGETDSFICFVCPECNAQTNIDWMELGKMRWYQSQIPDLVLKEKFIEGEAKNG